MKNIKYLSVFGLLSLVILGCSSSLNKTSVDADYAIVGVDLISMLDDKVVENQTVLVKGKKIVAIGHVNLFSVQEHTKTISGEGHFLIPGLAEMHAHIPIPVNGDTELLHDTMKLFIANGITTLRGMKGDLQHLTLKQQTEAGDVVGPRIFTSGPRLNRKTVKSVAAAHKIVKQQFDAGFDFIKIHRALKPELFHAIADAADNLGIGIAGHIPQSIGLQEALSRNYLTVDHFDGYMEALVAGGIEVVPYKNGGVFAVPLALKTDLSKMDELVALTKQNNTWVVPTQAWLERLIDPVDPESYLSEPGMAYISEKTKSEWTKWKKLHDKNVNNDIAQKYIRIHRLLLKKMHDAGVGTLFGADAPQFGNVPGFSMHHEIKAYQAAGLSNYEILKMATINPAMFFKQTSTFGTIAIGLEADLVLIKGNPIENMENLKKPAGVMVRGKWYSEDYLEEQLQKIAMKYQ